MEVETMTALAKAGGAAALSIAAIGSALGSGYAGLSAVGAWKRCFAQDRDASFLLVIFVGAPLSQIIYGMILMNNIKGVAETSPQLWPMLLIAGALAGVGMAFSAAMQGKAGAAGADALGETGKGFALYLMTIGMVETVALFVLVFTMGLFG